MNRRDFLTASIITAAAAPKAVHSTDSTSNIPTGPAGPYYIEIYVGSSNALVAWPIKNSNVERTLPLFDNMKQATNFAQARKNLLKMDSCMAGKILIRGEDDKVAGELIWESNWSTEKIYVEEPYHGIRDRIYNE